MLYPQSNRARWVTNLNGIWKFAAIKGEYDPQAPLQEGGLTAVPASMNELVTDPILQSHVGEVVYEREFSLPLSANAEYRLRIGAASHRCRVYLNGEWIGEGINGYDPVDLPLKALLPKSRLAVVIDNRLTNETFPAGRLKDGKQVINHDFYNYTGIHRDVLVYTRPKRCIEDVSIQTMVEGDPHRVRVDVISEGNVVGLTVLDREGAIVAEATGEELWLSDPRLWSPEDPYLYTLVVETRWDLYEERFGIRSVEVRGDQFLLNGKPVYFKGFGMHEDFFLLGKGNNGAVNVRNFELLKWIGANSIRTSHYPYSEEILSLADEYGILVIDEVPAVGMNWWEENYGENGANERTLALHRELIRRLHARDKNHPSVVMVSVANEAATNEAPAEGYFKNVMDYARELWRLPVTVVEFYQAQETLAAQFADVLCINRYFGWYYDHGDLSVVEDQMREELGRWHERFGKPVFVTEFGCDTVEGLHMLPAESFSEEFQLAYFEACGRAFDACPFCIGEHPWAFADFKTKQGLTRVRGNRKGVFTKDRQPKSAARFLRERWKNLR